MRARGPRTTWSAAQRAGAADAHTHPPVTRRRVGSTKSIASPTSESPTDYECWDGLPSSQPDETLPKGDDPPTAVAWEYWDGKHWALFQAEDPTRGLTLDGTVKLTIPETAPFVREGRNGFRLLGKVLLEYCYIRCRLAAGRPDVSPSIARIEVNAAELEQTRPATTTGQSNVYGPCLKPHASTWSSDHKTHTYEDAPIQELARRYLYTLLGERTPGEPVCNDDREKSAIKVKFGDGPNDTLLKHTAVRVWAPTHTKALFAARLLSPADPLEDGTRVLTLTDAPVMAGTVRIVSLEPDDVSDRSWTLRSWSPAPQNDLVQALPADAVYTLDPGSGTVTFGNGIAGRAIPAGALVLAKYDITCALRATPRRASCGMRWGPLRWE